MDFHKVTFDNELEDMEADELRGLVREFYEAQSDNIAEFTEAKESIEALEGRVGEVSDFDEELTEELAEVSPLDEEELSNFSISRKRSLLADFSESGEGEGEGEEDDVEGGQSFSDMGNRGETHGEDESGQKFAEDYLSDIAGLN